MTNQIINYVDSIAHKTHTKLILNRTHIDLLLCAAFGPEITNTQLNIAMMVYADSIEFYSHVSAA